MSGAHRPLAERRICLATHNAGKAREVEALLAEHGIEVVTAGELGLPVPEETETTFIGNASLKALAAARASGMVAMADDSGFSVRALNGAPGVYTANWAEQPDGSRDYGAAMAKVERLARHSADHAAWFSCALVIAWPDGHVEPFLGEAPGRWIWPPRGERGFGYDPMFVPDGGHETFAEMEPARKHAISHRAAAFRLLSEACLPPR
ncbi:non-canonical purine NTP pyrophosphatase [Muricoccus vinaceus]|uniref:dITP/XTP pyrophosphatase n=1 Tax=Muricoccus vinaceus TaxID=424704 RepID=A0ABV6IPK8_9PROT